MGRQVDVDDIIDTAEVAEVLGLSERSGRNTVSGYRRDYPDFPEPAKVLSQGRCLLWLRSEIEAWKAGRERRS